MKYFSVILSVLSASVLTGCLFESQKGNGKVDKDIEGRVQINQGLYGLAYYVNDVGNSNESIAKDFRVRILRVSGPETTAVDSTASNKSGIYEIAIVPGDYLLCTSFNRCLGVSVSKGLLRCDYEFSVGPGWLCSK